MTTDPGSADVLVVGGGPAGAATAIPLARMGRRVVIIERNSAARPHGYGNLITSGGLAALARLDLLDRVDLHPISRVRLTAAGRSTAVDWPTTGESGGRHAATAHRHEFDAALLAEARAAGTTVLTGHEAVAPIVERGFVRGARVIDPDGAERDLRAGFTVIADGASSRFGRALGTSRRQDWPWAEAQSATFHSPLGAATEIEVVLDLRDRAGTPITGTGWMFPMGDGKVSVGVLLHSTSPSFQVINPAHLLDRFVADQREAWSLEGGATHPPATGRIPFGLSVGPSAGPTYLTVGDAVGAANPMSGAGVDAAIESGMLAAEVLAEALEADTAFDLQRYPKLLNERFGSYYRMGRLTARVLGHPTIATRLGRLAAGRRGAAESFTRLVTRELRPGRIGSAEAVYQLGRTASAMVPEA